MRFTRTPSTAAALTSVLLVARAASAASPEACAEAAEHGQESRGGGRLRVARQHLEVCAHATCPASLRDACTGWLADLETVTPTVIVTARVGDLEVTDVQVHVDGALVAHRLDPAHTPIPIDPGAHTVRFERAGVALEQPVTIAPGVKAQPIAVSFPSTVRREVARTPSSDSTLVPALLVAGVSVAALGTAAVFGVARTRDESDLDRCRPSCDDAALERARAHLVTAGVTGGVGLLAAGIASYLLLARHGRDADAPSPARSPSPPRIQLDARPLQGGAAARFGIAF